MRAPFLCTSFLSMNPPVQVATDVSRWTHAYFNALPLVHALMPQPRDGYLFASASLLLLRPDLAWTAHVRPEFLGMVPEPAPCHFLLCRRFRGWFSPCINPQGPGGLWIVVGDGPLHGGHGCRVGVSGAPDRQWGEHTILRGQAQTEPFRTHILNGPYALVFTTGAPPPALDTSWVGTLGLTGFVGAEGRGGVRCVGILGRDTSYDAVLIHLNGTEIWRDPNITSGPVAYSTPATVALGGDDETAGLPLQLPPSVTALLLPGWNTLAAEVHNQNLNSSDIGFDLELNAQGILESAPELTVSLSGGNLLLTWPFEAGYFAPASTPNLTPPLLWTPVQGAPLPVGDRWVLPLPILPNADRFYRLEIR